MGLPISRVIVVAIGSACAVMRSNHLRRMRARSAPGVCFQAGNTSTADSSGAAGLVGAAVRDLGQGLAGGGVADGESARGAAPLAGDEGLPGPGRSITHDSPLAVRRPSSVEVQSRQTTKTP